MTRRRIGFGAVGSVMFIIMAIMAAFGAFLWPYTLNSWLAFFGKPESIVWWQGVILGFIPFIGHITIPAAIITWILMLFLT